MIKAKFHINKVAIFCSDTLCHKNDQTALSPRMALAINFVIHPISLPKGAMRSKIFQAINAKYFKNTSFCFFPIKKAERESIRLYPTNS